MNVARVLQSTLVVAFGISWAIRTWIGLQDPQYYHPVTSLDYAAVWTYSVALVLSSGVVWLIGWLARSHRPSALTALIVGAGLLVAAIANGFEDGFGMKWVGTIYVVGAMVGGYGLFVLAGALAYAGARFLAIAALTMVLGFILLGSIGGFFVLALSLLFAERLLRRPETLAPRPRPTPAAEATPEA
ncbi:MAG: hypothetical protein HW391_1053 [Chloroflexi bacterium]|nr:hypothetical protein [Chloroflexota bacterium]